MLARRPVAWLALWWPAVLLGFTTIGAYGAVYYSFGVFIGPISQDTGWTTGLLAGAFSLSVLAGGAGALVAGRTLDRAGSRPVLLAALLLGCSMLFAASLARESWQFVIAWTVGAGAVSGGLYYHVTMAVTARLYPEQRAAAFSVLTLLGALAGPLFYPLAGWLVGTLDWRDAMRVLVLVLALCSLPAALLVRARPAPRSAPAIEPRRGIRLPRELGERRVLLFLAMIGCMSLGSSALTLYQVPAMQATGLSLAAASTIAGLRGFFQFGGRVFLSPLTTWAGVAGASALCYGVAAGGTAFLVAAGPVVFVFIFIAMTGVSLGLLAPLNGLFAAEVYAEERMGTLMGVQQVVLNVTGAAGPLLGGMLLDVSGSYRVMLAVAAVVQFLALLILAAQRRADRSRTSLEAGRPFEADAAG